MMLPLNGLIAFACLMLMAGGSAVAQPATSSRLAPSRARSSKIVVCHAPPGRPDRARTLSVAPRAVAGHLLHGDELGECPSSCDGAPAPLPVTGQTGCWNNEGVQVDCGGTGADGEYQKGISVAPRFVDRGDGTVEDRLTRLVWLRDANCFSTLSSDDALAVANALASGQCALTDGSQAGDWRLPNIRELLSLVDYGQSLPAIPPGSPFLNVMPDNYISSTTDDNSARFNDARFKWFVYLGYGNSFAQTGPGFVWPVRDAR